METSTVSVFHRITVVPCHPATIFYDSFLSLHVCLRKSNPHHLLPTSGIKRRQIKRERHRFVSLQAMLYEEVVVVCEARSEGRYTSVHLACLLLEKKLYTMPTSFLLWRRMNSCKAIFFSQLSACKRISLEWKACRFSNLNFIIYPILKTPALLSSSN